MNDYIQCGNSAFWHVFSSFKNRYLVPGPFICLFTYFLTFIYKDMGCILPKNEERLLCNSLYKLSYNQLLFQCFVRYTFCFYR